MIQYKPNLQIRRVRVMAGAVSAYDVSFHEGVNIIAGQNASGKSTIMDFIFYGIGGESVPWKNEALLCTDVFVELSLNSVPVTLRRVVNEERRNPIQIFWEICPALMRRATLTGSPIRINVPPLKKASAKCCSGQWGCRSCGERVLQISPCIKLCV